MADTLMDRLRAQQTTLATAPLTPTSPQGSASGQLSRALATKAGRYDQPAAGVASESLGEAGANAQVAQAAQGQAQQVGLQVQADQQAEQTQQRMQGQQEQAQTLSERAQQGAAKRQAAEMATQLQQGKVLINLEKDRAGAERAGATARLANDQYVTRLGQEGDARRLNDALSFKKEALKSQLGADLDVLKGKLNDKELYEASDLDFQTALKRLEIKDMIALGTQKAKGEAAANMATGAGKLVEGGARAYDASGTSKTEKGPRPTDGSGNTKTITTSKD